MFRCYGVDSFPRRRQIIWSKQAIFVGNPAEWDSMIVVTVSSYDTVYAGFSGAFGIGPAFEFSYDFGSGEFGASWAFNSGAFAYGEFGVATDNEAAASQMEATNDDCHVGATGPRIGRHEGAYGFGLGVGPFIITENPDTPQEPF